MKSKLLFLVALTLISQWVLSGTLWAEEKPLLPENPLEGQSYFSSKQCIKCHAIQGVGGKVGPDLGKIRYTRSFLEIASSLWNHFPRMNEAFQEEDLTWTKFSSEEMRLLITYLYSVNYFDRPANAVLGERIFRDKKCQTCHSVGGKGGDIGPELDEYQFNLSSSFFTAALWNHWPVMAETLKEMKISVPQLEEGDVIDILAFIRAKGFSEETEYSYLPVGNPATGKTLFESKNCIRCHSVRGQGGRIGPDLAVRNLKGSLSYISSQMWNHGSRMRKLMLEKGIEYPEFTPEEMSDLTFYLYFLKFEDPPGSLESGEQVFAQKRCKNCHFPDENGHRVGPDLAEKELDTAIKILVEMWNHAPDIEEAMKENNIRWPQFEKEEMGNLIKYILSLSN